MSSSKIFLKVKIPVTAPKDRLKPIPRNDSWSMKDIIVPQKIHKFRGVVFRKVMDAKSQKIANRYALCNDTGKFKRTK